MSPSRLGRGEVIAAAGAVVLVVALFALPWFRFTAAGGHTDASGFRSLPILRWFLLVSAAGGLAIAALQAARRAPAAPVAADVVAVTFAALTTLLLLIRLPTSDGSPLAGAFAGLAASAAITAGAFMALRRESGWVPDAEHPVERVPLTGGDRPS